MYPIHRHAILFTSHPLDNGYAQSRFVKTLDIHVMT